MTHHTDAELLPCPFCGSRARRSKGGAWHGTGCAGAHGCPAYLSALTYRTQEEADEAWNRRTPASQAQRVQLSADEIKEPKNGEVWRVEWWNESLRMMLPSDKVLHRFNAYRNGTLQFTLKAHAHNITQEKQG